MDPRIELKAIQAKIGNLYDNIKAAGREVTDQEADTIEELSSRVIQLRAAIDRGEKSAEVMDRVAALGSDDSDSIGGERFLDLSPSGIKSMARTMATQAQGSKALVAGGTTVTGLTLAPNIVRQGGNGLAFLSAIPIVQHDHPSFKYLRQSARTNAAAVVPAGDEKPVSTVTVQEVPGTLEVYATLSEPINKHLLRDSAALERFIGQELVYMVSSKVQADAITAFSAVSGMQTVTAGTDPLVSVRKGIAAVEDLGFEANLIVLNSADYLDIVTTRNAGGSFDVSGGVGADEEAPKLWGRQVVSVSSGIAAGTALVLDRNAVALDTDKVGLEVEWNPYAGFSTNTVQARSEGRFGFSVFQPAALASVTLSA